MRARLSMRLVLGSFLLTASCGGGSTGVTSPDGGTDAGTSGPDARDAATAGDASEDPVGGDDGGPGADADGPRPDAGTADGGHDAGLDARSDADAETGGDGGLPTTTEGEMLVLTYNVAGLPDVISGSSPARNTPLISPLLNGYDLVVVQEDFWYHSQLAADAEHPYQSEPMIARPTLWRMGDGLNRFSQHRFGELQRTAWARCSGIITGNNDCLTPKGFSVAETHLAVGASVYVYNLHMDAGGDDGDIDARGAQVDQLLADIASRAGSGALIVGGDTNLSGGRPEDLENLSRLIAGAGLTDVCRALECGEERIDRVLLRSSDALTLTPLEWGVAAEFVDADGDPLSDHEAIAARLRWELSSGG